MLGVHIRKFREFDLLGQQEESKLTVPGSYWLCHRNKIYKFTFMYHRTMRDIKEFIYKKELMKVIRRIIKNQPSLGQQFVTKNILVIYNHTSWTRQDKMFATLKFKNRDGASIVSPAIILTIKIIDDEIYESKKLNGNKIQYIDSESKTERKNSNVYKLKVNATDTNKHLNHSNINDDSSDLTLSNINNEKNTTNDKTKIQNTIECNDRKLLNNSTTGECVVNIENNDVNKTNNCSITNKTKQRDKNEFNDNIIDKSLSSSLNQIEYQEEEEEIQQKETELQLNDNTITQKNSIINSNDEGIIDSANLPYQYLIEKEIESAKKKIMKYPSSNTIDEESTIDSTTKCEDKYIENITKVKTKNVKNCTKNQVPVMTQNNEEQCTKEEHSIDSTKLFNSYKNPMKDQNNKLKKYKEFEKKMDDNVIKCSSNITDLIMKGRMLMIQQDQDSVSVVERKTKLDTDEVLDNSEKFETKDGEKCLVNSSLLKLKNLVKMIKMPKEETIKNNDDNKSTVHNTNNNNNVSLDNNECMNTKISTMHPSRFMFNLQDIPTSSKSCLQYDDEHESNMNNLKMKENNVSFKIQSSNNESDNDFNETFNSTERLDDTNHSISESTIDDSENAINNSNCESIENTSSNTSTSSNFPKIISDQIITIDQIPVGLQKIVQDKLSKRNNNNAFINSSKSNLNDTSLDNTIAMPSDESTNLEVNTCKTDSLNNVDKHSTSLTDNIQTTDNVDTSTVCSNIAVVKETEMPKRKRKRSDNHDTDDNVKKQCFETMTYDETLPLIQCKTYSSMNKKGKRKRERKDCKYDTKMSTGLVKIRKNSRVPNNKLQDITEEFYQDLMQHQNNEHNNNFNEQLLSSTKKRSYLETNNAVTNNDTRIKMLKFIEDITRGVKVVVKRINVKNISSIIGNSSSLAYLN